MKRKGREKSNPTRRVSPRRHPGNGGLKSQGFDMDDLMNVDMSLEDGDCVTWSESRHSHKSGDWISGELQCSVPATNYWSSRY